MDFKKEEFKYNLKNFGDNSEDYDEYEKTLEKDIEKNCELSVYVNKFELDEKSDEELLKMKKFEIIDFKNYQIQKLKAYILSLEKEKEDLIENFKNTTNILIDKIKENEFRDSGIRPETPFITKKLKSDNINPVNNTQYKNKSSKTKDNFTNKNIFDNHEETKLSSTMKNFNDLTGSAFPNPGIKIQRCPQCTVEFPQEIFLQHSLDCLRNKIRCKKCNELIEEKNKKEHLLEWRGKEVSLKIKKENFRIN
jgi:hypothetical protein